MSDCMTQEDAERMDASQAVQILKPLRAMMLDQYGCPISDVYFALGKAIEALEQPTVDAVTVVRCSECKYLNIVNGKEVYAFCGNLPVLFFMFDVDTREFYCADGEVEKDD